MEARNRIIDIWYGKIQRGEIRLPRFQRYEAWDCGRISSFINTITNNLPLGITLVLEIGDKEPFHSRYLSTAPQVNGRILEHLLDGQQRLTALWRVLNNNYEQETYYIYIPEFDPKREHDSQFILYKSRYPKGNNQKYPLWCDIPQECLNRGFIPTHLLRPGDIQSEIDNWIEKATNSRKPTEIDKLEEFFNGKKAISDKIKDLRSIITNYNLPYLSLPSITNKETALEVFINMNTNSKPLTVYDIIVAEVENVAGKSLHDLQSELKDNIPVLTAYGDISTLILNTAALLQEKLPNQRGAWDMDLQKMIDEWENVKIGLKLMTEFLFNEGILDQSRLPTNAILAVIAALYPLIPVSGDERGVAEVLLKKYLWSAFFTDRYDNSTASRAYSDFIALKKVLTKSIKTNGDIYQESDVAVLKRSDHPIATVEQFIAAPWPKNVTTLGRGILAIACKLGSCDFATGQKIDRNNISIRHYHHIFPDSLLKEAEVESFRALNCSLIIDITNLNIGRKDPLKYLKERYKWINEDIVNERLNSHLIPIQELSNGGYENIVTESERKEKIKEDFTLFINKRARLMITAAIELCEGKNIYANDIIKKVENFDNNKNI